MKHICQIIALYLPGISLLQVLVALAIAFLLVKMAVTKFLKATKGLSGRKKTGQLENDMWAIE
ncbi:MAG: hypothetical protein JWR18_2887 [Segetibacter sp.]|jgi:divalent metal cation (Fe/Co/Zn/Cd) transporter|nr:hypothetical protein [Segetibacter sp.]